MKIKLLTLWLAITVAFFSATCVSYAHIGVNTTTSNGILEIYNNITGVDASRVYIRTLSEGTSNLKFEYLIDQTYKTDFEVNVFIRTDCALHIDRNIHSSVEFIFMTDIA